ncbi:hypothetical protein D9619_007243 [Psilocybe cf. subviscida]|uniref:Bud22 domain-containing protein n=1 Tax=Psilocybe cf. subviscida TaxID=2480587 RepID=A0A8H5B171_9AGAR|nr:hypothetical protein D9619_007243 [Psilocybe cf. subviscida]
MDQNSNRGTKRKRYEPAEEPISTRIAGKLHHQVKEVHKASKIAKSQETQKIVKRLKDIRKKDAADKAIEGFEAELSTLKEIDHDAVGNSAFKTKILKDHTLKLNDDVKTAMTKEFNDQFLVPAAPGTTVAKIQSRLLSSKILATQILASMDSLKILLNPALKHAAASVADEKDAVEQLSSRPSKSLKSSASSGPTSANSDTVVQTSSTAIEENDDDDDKEEDDGEGGESDSSRDFGGEGWETGSLGGEDVGVDHGWESGSVGSASGRNDDDDDESASENDSESDNEDLKVQPTKSKPAKAPAKTKPAPKPTKDSSSKMESTFLPSLAVGFVRGSDDSDFSDTEAQDADLPKKNRRGQRARRAIWEKKFGRNANHKKKEAELAAAHAAKSKNSGHTSKTRSGSNAIPAAPPAGSTTAQGPSATGRGATRGNNVSQSNPAPVDAGWGGRSTSVSAPTSRPTRGPPTKADEKPLHPSWEAKKKLKEKESAGIVPSQGVKIKFT